VARWQVTIAVFGLAAAAYMADYIAARTRAIGTVEVARYYAIPLKNGQTQFSFAGNKEIACVKSLFPHFGDQPCWYVDRNKEQWIRP
jgi:hypothetical protein